MPTKRESLLPVLNVKRESLLPVLNVKATCDLPVLNVKATCDLPVLNVKATCDLPVLNVKATCDLPVLNVKATCDLLQSSQKVHPISPNQVKTSYWEYIQEINCRHYTMSNIHINIDFVTKQHRNTREVSFRTFKL